MTEQKQPSIQLFKVQTASKQPIHSLFSYRMLKLKSQVDFYEGQLDPLLNDNALLKQHFMNALKLMTISSDILKKMIPTASIPSKKLKIDLANMEELCGMVYDQWQELKGEMEERERQVQRGKSKCSQLLSEIQALETANQEHIKVITQQYNRKQQQLQQQIGSLKAQIEQSQQNNRRKITDLQQELKITKAALDIIEQQNSSSQQASTQKCLFYQRQIQRLNQMVQNSQRDLEEGKKVVKNLCEKLMNDKITETVELYEFMLKAKEQEKMALALSKEQSQEDLQKVIQSRNQSIRNLTTMLEKQKTQISTINSRLYAIDESLAFEKNLVQTLRGQLIKSNDKIETISADLKAEQTKLLEQEKKYNEAVLTHEKNLVKIAQQYKQRLKELQKEKQILKGQLEICAQKILQLECATSQVEEVWTQKINELKEIWKQKQQDLNKELVKKNALIQQGYLKTKQIREKAEQQIYTLKTRHQDDLYNLDFAHKKQTEEINREHQRIIKKYETSSKEEKMKLQLEYKNKLSSIVEENHRKLQEVTNSCNIQLNKQHIKYSVEQDQLKRQLLMAQIGETDMRNKLTQVENILINHEKQLEEVKVQCIKKVNHMEERDDGEKKRLNDLLQQQMKDFQKELEKQMTAMCNMQAEMQAQIDYLKDIKGITAIQQKFQQDMENAKYQFREDLTKAEERFAKNLRHLADAQQRQLKVKQTEHQIQIISLKEAFAAELGDKEEEFRQKCITLAEKGQDSSSYLNDRMVCGILEGDLTKATTQQVYTYLHKIFEKNKTNIANLEEYIIFQEEKLLVNARVIQQFQNKNEFILQEKLKNRRQQYQRLKKQLLSKMEILSAECSLKLTTAHQQKAQYTSNMFTEFSKLKKDHQHKYQLLLKRYNELEELFENRPSRSQDVTKIKELTAMKEKMNIQMQSYQKKVQTANEIVKYLNLQLENYKQTYDIFGANTANQIFEGGAKSKTVAVSPDKLQAEKKKNLPMNELSKFKDELKATVRAASIRQSQSQVSSQLPAIKGNKRRESFIVSTKEVDKPLVRQKRMSQPFQRTRLKTDKAEKMEIDEKGPQLVAHAQNFMKMMKEEAEAKQELQGTGKETKSKLNMTIRRRRMSRKVPTQPVQHYE